MKKPVTLADLKMFIAHHEKSYPGVDPSTVTITLIARPDTGKDSVHQARVVGPVGFAAMGSDQFNLRVDLEDVRKAAR